MSTIEVKQYDVVKLVDGREGTVVEIYTLPDVPIGYEIELKDTDMELVTVERDKIASVIHQS